MKDDNCIFCKLANGDIPTNSIYEDDDFKVILDASPATKGHALILPKQHYANMAEKAGVSKKDAEASLKAFTDVVAEELKKGEKIQLVGFGTFEVSERAARTGRNPQTGAEMTIAASKAPKFKAGKALKDSLN
jgi:DNA-binding protein HU-beta